MTERPIDLGRVSAVLETLLRDSGKPVCITDLTTGEVQPVSPELAASPAGLLPLFLAAGDTVWRDTTGRRLGIKQVDDPQSLLGVRTESIGAGPVTPVLLSVMEAIAQAERPDMLLVNDMSRNWATASDRMRRLRLRPVEAKPASSCAPSSEGMQP
jgi:hypothetical protein